MKVTNIINRNGNTVPNQFLITHKSEVFFQWYQAKIVAWKNGKIFLDNYYWDYSRTTGKYRNIVLRETIKETRQKIKSGDYILTNLNGSI